MRRERGWENREEREKKERDLEGRRIGKRGRASYRSRVRGLVTTWNRE